MGEAYVLVAECDAYQLARFRDLKLGGGLELVVARDGLDARTTLRRRGAPALLMLDLNLPIVDGLSVLRELRKLSATARAVAHSSFPSLRAAANRMNDMLKLEAVLSFLPTPDDVRALLALKHPLSPPEPAPDAATLVEEKRLARLESLGLRTPEPAGPELQRIVDQVAKEFGMPVALVSLVYRDIQFFKAQTGLQGFMLEQRGTPREWSFCQHVVTADRPEPLIVGDALDHPAFKNSPLVEKGLVRSYLGAPIIASSGEILGSLCVSSAEPHQFAQAQVQRMQLLARRVGGELDLMEQRRLARLERQPAPATAEVGFTAAQIGAIFGTLEIGVLLSDRQGSVLYANPALMHHFGLKREQVQGQPREAFVEHLVAQSHEALLVRGLLAHAGGPFIAREEFDLDQPRKRRFRWVSKPLPLSDGLGQICYFIDLSNPVQQRALEEAVDPAKPLARMGA